MSYQRPAFWRIPHNRPDPEHNLRRKVNIGTPAQRELLRGDIITKIDDYDARDLRHEDAQNLFRNAGNNIKIAIQRDASKMGSMSNGSSRCGSSMQHSPLPAPYIPIAPSSPYSMSPVSSAPGGYRNVAAPVSSLPHTVFPPENPWAPSSSLPHTVFPPENPWAPSPCFGSTNLSLGPSPQPHFGRRSPALFSPMGYREESADEGESIVNQPYRTTPLVLPGAKVKRENGPTESYLRHHPNPAMRAAPHHDHDVLMKQKVADTMLHRVGGEEAAIKYAHKQFNSPIGLYSEANIVDTIKRDTNTVPMNGSLGRPVKSKSYKKTVLYNPANSETFKALQEEALGDIVQEVAAPAQTKVFHAPTSRAGPVKQPVPQKQPPPQPKNNTYVSTLNDETIHQSNSFKRLMYHVLGETEY